MQRDLTEYMHAQNMSPVGGNVMKFYFQLQKKYPLGHSNSESTNKTDKVMDINKDNQANKFNVLNQVLCYK